MAEGRWRFRWIHSRRADLVWYIGSALAGWLYLALALSLGRGLEDPLRDPFYTLSLPGFQLPLTLGLVVVASWAVLVDAPHVWATLARTWLDPDEWSERRGMLLGSLAWFAAGPLAVAGPVALGAVLPLPAGTAAFATGLFFVLFRLWAYYHVVRQHWGFLVLYKRKNDDWSDPAENRADLWFFNAALYLPVVLFVSAPWYRETGMPPLGLDRPLLAGWSLASVLRPLSLALYPLVIAAYAVFQFRRLREGRPRNGPKLLLLLSVVPLHLVVFLHPLLALFVVPIVTVGHNLQYHRIVWAFGQGKYAGRRGAAYRFARASFRSVPVYFALGLTFTLLCYQGPFVDFVKTRFASAIDGWLVGGLGLLSGVSPVAGSGLGARIAATLFMGWAMQHYYLDSRIWRVRRDARLAEHLRLG